jgi:hypothetical protein
MWQILSPMRPKAAVLALRLNAERAGTALACPFSSSDEFEAAVIRSRLRAGIYGPKRLRRSMAYGVAAAATFAALLLLI